MAAPHTIDPIALLEQHLTEASPDLLRQMIAAMANAMMSAQADQVCGADYGERSPGRTNQRNGYRAREWDTRVGTVELAVPKLRQGSFFPDWLLTHRRRAEQALVTVVATAYLLGVSTRRVERLAEQLGVKSLSRSQVSEMAAHLDGQVTAFRQRPLDAGPYTFCWVDALTVKVREDGRVVNVHALIATGVNRDGHREILGLDVASAEDGAGWLAFLRGLARGLSGVQLVIGDAHPCALQTGSARLASSAASGPRMSGGCRPSSANWSAATQRSSKLLSGRFASASDPDNSTRPRTAVIRKYQAGRSLCLPVQSRRSISATRVVSSCSSRSAASAAVSPASTPPPGRTA